MKKFIILLSALFISVTIYAQSAEVVTKILESPKITCGQACYLSAVSQNLIDEDASYEDAISALLENRQIINKETRADSEIVLADLAAIYTRMFNLKGGLMYRISKGSPRYSLKLLKADGVVPANSDPSKVLSGSEALSLYTSCIMKYGEYQFDEDLYL